MSEYFKKIGDDKKIKIHPTRDSSIKNLPKYNIVSMLYNILTDTEVSKNAVTTINLIGNKSNTKGTTRDLNLGAVNEEDICLQCNQKLKWCIGHMGKIVLKNPIINPIYIESLIHILNSVCHGCGNILGYNEELVQSMKNIPWDKKLAQLSKKCSKAQCSNIESEIMEVRCQSVREIHKAKSISACYPIAIENDLFVPMKISEIISILKNISKKHLEVMGFKGENTPLNYINYVLPIYSSRAMLAPSINFGKDTITAAYEKIISINAATPENASENEQIDAIKAMTEQMRTIIFGAESKADNPTATTISMNLKSKRGMMRSDLFGKNSDFVGRFVATPGGDLLTGQVGIPKIAAETITVTEIVSQNTVEIVKKWITDGTILKYNRIRASERGHFTVVTENDRINEAYLNNVKVGDEYRRKLMNGDRIIVNRQPTLHGHSMMSHEVILTDSLTVSVPLSVTGPYNLDFDGDEINIQMAQGEGAVREMTGCMNVTKRLMNPENSSPIIALAHNSFISAFKLTSEKTLISKEDWMQYVVNIGFKKNIELLESIDTSIEIKNTGIYKENYNSLEKRHKELNVPFKILSVDKRYTSNEMQEFYTGRALFSMLFPNNFSYKKISQLADLDEERFKNVVEIKNGVLISGRLTKSELGAKPNSIIHKLSLENDYNTTVDFINNATKLLNMYMSKIGFSIGYYDCSLDEFIIKNKIQEIIRDVETKLDFIPKKSNDEYKNRIRNNNIKSIIETGFNEAKSFIVNNVSLNNPLIEMILSGTKGDIHNITQTGGLVGLQYLYNDLITMKEDRLVPSQIKGEVIAPGFCKSSYSKGLTPVETYYTCLASRQQLVETVTNTPKAGALRRQVVSAVNNILSYPDGSLRDGDSVISTIYGTDGISPEFMIDTIIMGQKVSSFCNFDNISENVVNKITKMLNEKQ